MASKCSYSGCEKPRVKDRMFCSEHVNAHDVSDIASFRTGDRQYGSKVTESTADDADDKKPDD
jgi:hypothetical protein